MELCNCMQFLEKNSTADVVGAFVCVEGGGGCACVRACVRVRACACSYFAAFLIYVLTSMRVRGPECNAVKENTGAFSQRCCGKALIC